MTKKWKDTTDDGFKIVALQGPDIDGSYAGILEHPDGALMVSLWNGAGKETTYSSHNLATMSNLVPAEPEISYIYVTGFLHPYRLEWEFEEGLAFQQNGIIKLGSIDGKLISAEVL